MNNSNHPDVDWTAWLDSEASPDDRAENDPADYVVEKNLAELAGGDETLKTQWLRDLRVHRTLSAWGRIERSDDRFAESLLERFESEVAGESTLLASVATGESTLLASVATEESTLLASVATEESTLLASVATEESTLLASVATEESTLLASVATEESTLLASVVTGVEITSGERASRRRFAGSGRNVWPALYGAAAAIAAIGLLTFAVIRANRHPRTATPTEYNELEASATNGESAIDRALARRKKWSQVLFDAPSFEAPSPAAEDRIAVDRAVATGETDANIDSATENEAIQPQTAPSWANDLLEFAAGQTYATAVDAEDARWSDPLPPGGRLNPGGYQLLTGAVELKMDRGGTLQLVGPAEFSIDTNGDFCLESGQLTADFAQLPAGPTSIQSPANRFTPAAPSRFAMRVDGDRPTEVSLDRGAVLVQPWHGRVVEDPLWLSTEGYDRLTIDETEPTRPRQAQLRDRDGDFEGWIELNGQLLRSGNERFCNSVFERVQQRYQQSPNDVAREWANFVRLANADSILQLPSQPESRVAGDLNDFIDFSRNFAQSQARASANSNSQSNQAFDGVLNINGQEMRFRSPEEFDAARRQLFGNLADVFDSLQQ